MDTQPEKHTLPATSVIPAPVPPTVPAIPTIINNEHPPGSLITLATLVVVVWGVGEARTFLIPVCIAALLAVLMSPLVRFFNRRRFPEWLSIAVSTILLLAPVISALSFLGYEIQLIIRDLPKIGKALNQFILDLAQKELPSSLNISTQTLLPHITERVVNSAGEGLQFILFGVKGVFEAGIQALVVLVLAIVMIAARRDLRHSFEGAMALRKAKKLAVKSNIPKTQSPNSPDLINSIVQLVEQFILTRVIIVAIVGVLDFIILRGFSIEFSFILATFFGIMTLVPAVGFILGLTPTLIIAISYGHSLGNILGTLGCLTVISAIESHILSPKLLGTRLNLNLLATLLGVLAWSLLWGVWGLLLGVPILGILRIVLCQSPTYRRWGMLLADSKSSEAPQEQPRVPTKKAGLVPRPPG